MLLSFTWRYVQFAPNFRLCLPTTLEKLSERAHVLAGCLEMPLGPVLKLLKLSDGTASFTGKIPNPLPSTNPRLDSFTPLPFTAPLVSTAVRIKLTRASLTAVGPKT